MQRQTNILLNNNMKQVILESDSTIEETYCYSKKEQSNTISFSNEELNNEIWKCLNTIYEEYKNFLSSNSRYLNLYNISNIYISNLGRIAKFKDNKFILCSCFEDKDGYKLISNNHNIYAIHVLMLLIFNKVPSDKNSSCDHINFIKNDNRISNLRWISIHINSGRKNISFKQNNSKTSTSPKESRLICVNLETNEETYFNNQLEISKFLNIPIETISLCINGIIETINNQYKIYSTEALRDMQWIPIVQLEMNTNKVLNVFLTKESFKEQYPNFLISNIKKAYKSNIDNQTFTYTSYNYQWITLEYYETFCLKYEWYKPLNHIHKDIIQLSPGFKITKIYSSILDIINDGFNIDKVFKLCNKKSKECLRFSYKKFSLKRNFWYLVDYLNELQISDICEISESMYSYSIPNSLKTNINPNVYSKSNNESINNDTKELLSELSNQDIIITDNSYLSSYEIEFTNEELNNEIWRSLKLLDIKYKEYFISDGIWLNLYNENNYYISNLGRVAKYDKKKKGLVLKKAIIAKDGYKQIYLFNNVYPIHRLVAFLFIENEQPNLYWHIHHKNFIRYDNRVINLMWCDIIFNNQNKKK